jgi:hypothetical protein
VRGHGTVTTATLGSNGFIEADATTKVGSPDVSRPLPSGDGPAVQVIRSRPRSIRSASSTAVIARRTTSGSGASNPSPAALRSIRRRCRVSANGTLSTTLIASNTPSPTVNPWSRMLSTGSSGWSRSRPFAHTCMARP